MKKTTLIIAAIFLSLCGIAQNNGKLTLRQDDRIDNLMDKQHRLHAIDSTLNGFRVQIFMEVGNDAIEHAETKKREFQSQFRGIPVYLSYGQPYYRLRVGDFRTRVEAEKCLRMIKGRFTNAFVTADVIFSPKTSAQNQNDANDAVEQTGEDFVR